MVPLLVDYALDGIRVNAIAPGVIDTQATAPILSAPDVGRVWLESVPMRRARKPDEMAKVVAFLASDEASYITGQTIGRDCLM